MFFQRRGAKSAEHFYVFEWEVSLADLPVKGNLRNIDYLQLVAASDDSTLQQCYGDIWEWTAGAYAPYPGYCVPEGDVGEYVRVGSTATSLPPTFPTEATRIGLRKL